LTGSEIHVINQGEILMRSKKSARSTRTIGVKTVGSWTVGLTVCVLAAAVLMAARQPATTTRKAKAAVPPAEPQQTSLPARAGSATESAAAKESASKDKEAAAATITGCLERDDKAFRLTDTAGAQAPKARSWKSGFLKKGPAPIEVVDSENKLNLPNQVGRRVSISGTRVDREMQARSLRRVGGSCG
jgi:hypothetical protein